MKKLLMGLFIFGFLAMGSQAHASVLSDALLKIDNLTKEITQLRSNLSAAVFGAVDNSVVSEAPSASGTISATNCTIPSGSSTCNTTLVWNIVSQYIGNIPMVITPVSITVVKGQSSGTTTYPITYGSRIFSVISNPTDDPSTYSGILASATATATCASGTTWNGSICITTVSTPIITISSPINGGTYKHGNGANDGDRLSYSFKIDYTSGTGDIKVYLVDRNNSTWPSGKYYLLEADGNSNPASQGLYVASILLNNTYSNGNYYLLVDWKGNDGSRASTYTGNSITITDSTGTPSITVISPNGGETFTAGQQITVRWNSSNVDASEGLLIEMLQVNSINNPVGLARWVVLADSTPNDGIQTFTLDSNITPGKYELAVKGDMVNDMSDNVFTINSSSLCKITNFSVTPTTITEGDPVTISWSTTSSCTSLTVNSSNLDTYIGPVTNTGSRVVYPKIDTIFNLYTTDGANTIKSSDVSVKVNKKGTPSITVLSPNGGESITLGKSYTVSWTSSNMSVGDAVRIELYKNGVYQDQIAFNQPVNGTYNWTPAIGGKILPGTDYKIRIVKSYDNLNSVFDDSNSYFTITNNVSDNICEGGCMSYSDFLNNFLKQDITLIADEDPKNYLGGFPANFVDNQWINNEKLINQVAQLTKGKENNMEKARAIANWVKNSRIYKEPSHQPNTILEIFESNEGVCFHAAYLTSAMMRLAGIPSRTVSPEVGGVSHEYVEFFYDGKWYGVDSTFKFSEEYQEVNIINVSTLLGTINSKDIFLNKDIMLNANLDIGPSELVLKPNKINFYNYIKKDLPEKWGTLNFFYPLYKVKDGFISSVKIINKNLDCGYYFCNKRGESTLGKEWGSLFTFGIYDRISFDGELKIFQGGKFIKSGNVQHYFIEGYEGFETIPLPPGEYSLVYYKNSSIGISVAGEAKGIAHFDFFLKSGENVSFKINNLINDNLSAEEFNSFLKYLEGKGVGNDLSKNDVSQGGQNTLNTPPANPATPNYASSSNQTGGNDVSSTRTLGLGMRGDDVTTLQNYLNGQGYNCGVADGSFGQMTKAALIRWQIANGLNGDGLFGRMGRSKAGFTQ